jgi:hypothetical protein
VRCDDVGQLLRQTEMSQVQNGIRGAEDHGAVHPAGAA